MNVVSCDAPLARKTRLRLWSEHLEPSIEDVSGDPARVVDELWRPIAAEQPERRRRGDKATHRLLELPGVSRRSMALLEPVQGLLVDGQPASCWQRLAAPTHPREPSVNVGKRRRRPVSSGHQGP
jgi:hypothetical protein